jgi:hypothetical protein
MQAKVQSMRRSIHSLSHNGENEWIALLLVGVVVERFKTNGRNLPLTPHHTLNKTPAWTTLQS